MEINVIIDKASVTLVSSEDGKSLVAVKVINPYDDYHVVVTTDKNISLTTEKQEVEISRLLDKAILGMFTTAKSLGNADIPVLIGIGWMVSLEQVSNGVQPRTEKIPFG